MSQKIGYNGVPEYNKPRKLSETNNNQYEDSHLSDKKPPALSERQKEADELYRSIAETYIKGKKLLKGLAGMEPAAFIPIVEDSDAGISAARLYADESKNGTIITYSMFQKSVDYTYGQKWQMRKMYMQNVFPTTKLGETELISKTQRTTTNKGIIREFIEGNGLAGALIGLLCMTPFMSDFMLALSGEESGAKSVFSVKVVAGIALLLELGIKAYKIIELLKLLSGAKIPNLEQTVKDLEDPDKRKAALETIGIDPNEMLQSIVPNDHKKIIDYVAEYYNRYGGLAEPEGFTTIDHWVAYMHVAQNQLLLRGALNVADSYSTRFEDIRSNENANKSEPFTSSVEVEERSGVRLPKFELSITLASGTRALREKSNDIYDDILNSFMYQISDSDLCCLVSLFGAFKKTDMLRLIAAILRILATDLSFEIANIMNALKLFIANMLTAIIFELISKIDEVMQKILLKLVDVFTVNIEALKHCIGLLSIGWAIMDAVRVFFRIVKDLMRELMTIINDYAKGDDVGWSVAADRRHLFGIARILEVLATRLDLASVCELKREGSGGAPPIRDVEIRDITAGDVIYDIMGKAPPTLNLTNQEIEKYFPNQQSRTSKRLKFNYGIVDMQKSKREEGSACAEPPSASQLDDMVKQMNDILGRNY